MCRPEKPITTSNKPLRDLAEWLREQRERTRQSYRALSVRAGCHATTLQRVASGATVPKLQAVLSYARACDASPEEARLLWKRARYEQARLARGGRGVPVPRPEFIRDFVDLSAALQDLYEKAGSPALRTMEQRVGGYGVLPRSTAHRIITKQAMPHSLQQFQAYLRACEVPEADRPDWEAAWTRAWRQEKHDDFTALGASGPPDVDILAAIELTPKQRKRATASANRLRERIQHYAADFGSNVIVHDRTFRPSIQVTRIEPVRRAQRRRPAQTSRQFPERPVQGQLSFAIPEPAPEPDALF